MKSLINNIGTFHRESIRKKFYILVILFIATVIIGVLTYISSPKYFEDLINMVVGKINSMNLDRSSTFYMAMMIFINNLRVSVISLVVGFIPFLFVSAYPIVGNALILGVFTTMFAIKTGSIAATLAFILPHGIIELAAIIYAAALGINICNQINLKIQKRSEKKMATIIKSTITSFLAVVVPLLFVAALIEAYITPMIAKLFI